MLIKKTGTKSAEIYGKYSEFVKLSADDVEDCTLFYIKDWLELDQNTKDKLVKRVQMSDKEEHRWIPQ